jgi:hypothetical protein
VRSDGDVVSDGSGGVGGGLKKAGADSLDSHLQPPEAAPLEEQQRGALGMNDRNSVTAGDAAAGGTEGDQAANLIVRWGP